MKRTTNRVRIIICSVALVILISAFFFVFNPLGLGPEPETVLPRSFFESPAHDLSELELLVDGKEAFREIFNAIDSARSSIYVQTYIWQDDETGRKMVNKLKAAADRGVEVTVSKDMLGTVFELGYILKGKPSPVFTRSGLKGYRNINSILDIFSDTDHSKYFIIDKRLVIFGGMNIADEYHFQWHDYMAMIKSDRWTEAFRRKVMNSSKWPNPSPFIVVVNDSRATEIRTAMIEMIDNAAENLIIEHAYFSDDKIIEAVERAAGRGVTVDLVLPKYPDTHVFPNMVTINRLLESESADNIKIFFYPRMSHAKVMLADSKIAAIGSANLTPRSMFTSRELTLFVHGKYSDRFIRELRDQLDEDMSISHRITEPLEISVIKRVVAGAGKYLW